MGEFLVFFSVYWVVDRVQVEVESALDLFSVVVNVGEGEW